ncbi:MAG TPA: hypothetical protein VJS69_05370 [Candidatus Krumholzibacteria bacterium]|nr:hypothetical protein [Candidatus Krumholzibacteria bacterium]
MKRTTFVAGACAVIAACMACNDFMTEPYHVTVDPANFVAGINNPYYPLTPGKRLRYEGEATDGHETNIVTVSNQTYNILGVTCTVVEDTVLVDGEMIEATTDWFAQDTGGSVWYMGEASRSYENGKLASTEGSWEAGKNGALPGVIMYGSPKPGGPYRQEFQAGVAEDRGQVIATNATVTVPYGTFTNCIKTEEWSDIEPGLVEYKFYAKNVGVVRSVSVMGEQDDSKLVAVSGP